MQSRSADATLHKAFIAVGSNLGSRIGHLDAAVVSLTALAHGRLAASAVYETAPVGVTDQPKFLNMVVEIDVVHRPLELLQKLWEVENDAGRVRTVVNGPRTLDLDLLLYDNQAICLRQLTIPHPRMWQRGFVLLPLADLAANLTGLGGCTVAQMAARPQVREGIQYVGRFW